MKKKQQQSSVSKIPPPPSPPPLKPADEMTERIFLAKLRDIDNLLTSCIKDPETYEFSGDMLEILDEQQLYQYPDDGLEEKVGKLVEMLRTQHGEWANCYCQKCRGWDKCTCDETNK